MTAVTVVEKGGSTYSSDSFAEILNFVKDNRGLDCSAYRAGKR